MGEVKHTNVRYVVEILTKYERQRARLYIIILLFHWRRIIREISIGVSLFRHGAVDDEAEAGVDADEQLRAVVGHEEPERKEAAVVLSAEGVVPPGKTLLHVQYESAWGCLVYFYDRRTTLVSSQFFSNSSIR